MPIEILAKSRAISLSVAILEFILKIPVLYNTEFCNRNVLV